MFATTREPSSTWSTTATAVPTLGKLGRTRVEEELAWAHQERAYVGVYERLTKLAPRITGRPTGH